MKNRNRTAKMFRTVGQTVRAEHSICVSFHRDMAIFLTVIFLSTSSYITGVSYFFSKGIVLSLIRLSPHNIGFLFFFFDIKTTVSTVFSKFGINISASFP